MTKPIQRLGKGLSALIPQRISQPPQLPSGDHPISTGEHTTIAIAVDQIVPNHLQPRTTFSDVTLTQLADSIRQVGVLQPVVVRRRADGNYELVAGERRWRAAKLAGLTAIPAVVRDIRDAEALELALVENLQREDLAPLERASAYKHYLDTFGGTIEDLAQRLSESRASISNYMRLLNLRPEVCYLLGTGELGMGHARALAGIEDGKRQVALAKLAARRNLAVRQVEELARQASEVAAAAHGVVDRDPPSPTRQHLGNVAEAFSKALGLPVRIHAGKRRNSGRVEIAYRSLEEFDMISKRIGATAHLE